MNGAENLKQYEKRVKREAVLKAFIEGLACGMISASVAELVAWFMGAKYGLYIALALFVVMTVAISLIMYYKKYRPNVKAVAARVDELGLDERVLTMLELEGDDSYIAKAQKADTERALKKVNHLMLKFSIATSVIVLVAVCGFVMAGMTTVSGLAYAEVIPSGMDLIRDSRTVTYYASYAVKGEDVGKIYYVTADWDEPELVTDKVSVDEGEDAPAVIAVADPGYIVTGWSDGKTNPLRQDAALHGNVDVYALFEAIDDDPDADADPLDDLISPPASSGQEGPSQPGGQGNGSGDGAGGTSASRNQIIDGGTYYGHGYEGAVDEAYDSMNSDSTSDMYKDAASGYLDALDPGNEGDEGESEN